MQDAYGDPPSPRDLQYPPLSIYLFSLHKLRHLYQLPEHITSSHSILLHKADVEPGFQPWLHRGQV